jgi:8-oxo-dGTP pyrophosphatase MutT (NUDIX family)
MISAAGILFIAKNGNALYLKRGPGGDREGEWCFPGGKQEDGETLEECAAREAKEETGSLPKGDRTLWTRCISPAQPGPAPLPAQPPSQAPEPATDPAPAPLDAVPASPDTPIMPVQEQVDFTTFIQRIGEEFPVKVDGEHTGWCWAPLTSPPEPLHPGCRIAIDRLTMDEMGVAQAIANGLLTSPQRYDNVWLFAIRITGTGVAFRHKHDEFVWRDPALYLTEEFRQRCNGLPVIMEHPKKGFLNSKEFTDRIIGTVMLPYLNGEDVWGIAKIYDDEAATMMREEQLSTSPCVVFRDPTVNNKVELEDGSKLLIEGKPSLLDHVAVCYNGVWDKGLGPTGVQNDELVAADAAPDPLYNPKLGRAFALLDIHARSARLH